MTSIAMQTRYRVEGMDCASCAGKIDTAVRRVPGVEDVTVSVAAGSMTVHHAPESDLAAIEKKIAGLGYGVARLRKEKDDHDHGADHQDQGGKGLHGHDHRPAAEPWRTSAKGRLTIASGAALAAAFAVPYALPAAGPWIFIAAMLIGPMPIARRAVVARRAGRPVSVRIFS